jgi:hypothetical protein
MIISRTALSRSDRASEVFFWLFSDAGAAVDMDKQPPLYGALLCG